MTAEPPIAGYAISGKLPTYATFFGVMMQCYSWKRLTLNYALALATIWACMINVHAQMAVNSHAVTNVITWYEYNLPPISIINGADAEKGINNLFQKRLRHSLPEFQHQTRYANFARITEDMRSGTESALCVGFQKNPERENSMIFSEPFTIGLPLSVIVLKTRAADFKKLLNKDGQLSLTTMLASRDMHAGIASGRIYSMEIDQVLATHKKDANVMVRYGADNSLGLLEMLAAERFDFTIMFPEEAQYMAKALGAKVELVSFPLSETPPYSMIYVVAPRTTWGESMLAKLNPIILKIRGSTEFRNERELWMDPEARKRYRKLVHEALP